MMKTGGEYFKYGGCSNLRDQEIHELVRFLFAPSKHPNRRLAGHSNRSGNLGRCRLCFQGF